jgi:hypothetical protein
MIEVTASTAQRLVRMAWKANRPGEVIPVVTDDGDEAGADEQRLECSHDELGHAGLRIIKGMPLA